MTDSKSAPQPVLDAAQVEAIISSGLPMSAFAEMQVLSIAPGSALIKLAFKSWMIRPGGTIGGPVLMLAADAAMYAVVLAHIGDKVMAVTSNLNINFLRRPEPAAVFAEGRLLKLGRRLAVIEVNIRSEGSDEVVAHVTGTYSLPG